MKKQLLRFVGAAIAFVVLIFAGTKLITYFAFRSAVNLCDRYEKGAPFNAASLAQDFLDAGIKNGGIAADLPDGKGTTGIDMKRRGMEDGDTLKHIDDLKLSGRAHFTQAVGFAKYSCDITFAEGKSSGFSARWWD